MITVIGVGIATVGISLWERQLVREGKESEAEVVQMIASIVFLAGGILGGLYTVKMISGVFFL